MPVISLQSAGSQVVAKAGVNYFGYDIVGNNGVSLFPQVGLATPGLPNLTWIVEQTAGAGGVTVTCQVSLRRGDLQAGEAAPFYINIGPPSLLVPNVSTVFEFTAPVEFMRLRVSNASGGDATVQVALLSCG